MLPSDKCQWIGGWENPCWLRRGMLQGSVNTMQPPPPPVGKGGLFARAVQSRNETWMLWFTLQRRLSCPKMVTALWAAEVGYLMWGVGRRLRGQGERHGQTATWFGVEWKLDLGNFESGNYEKKLLQDFMMLMSFFWPDPLDNPSKSWWWVNLLLSVPAQSDTRDRKAERQKCWDSLMEHAARPKQLACFVLFF